MVMFHEKSSVPRVTRERTMKPQTSALLVACFAIAVSNNFGVNTADVSPMVDLDSDEGEETPNNTALNVIVDQNVSGDPLKSVSHALEPVAIGRRRGNELVKTSEPRKRRIYPSHDGTVKQPKIINNIHIVVNGNDNSTQPSGDSCARGACNVSVSSKSDEEGNIVTEVHLSIVTNAKSKIIKIDDVPVIDGFRGLGENRDEQPIFYAPNPAHSQLNRENIPQIQVNYQGYGEPWYQHRRIFQRPRGYSSHNSGFRGYGTWRDRPIVDDKIGPSLSKTKKKNRMK